MSEPFYRAVRWFGGRIFRHASQSHILHAERAARPGAYVLAANHTSPFDPALLIAATPRVIYWLSIAEIFRHPLWGRFLRGIGAEPLDRGKVDTRTMRVVMRNLRAGRVVGIFPEGGVRSGADCVLAGGTIHDGVCKLAQIANVPVLPCVILGSGKFRRWTCWLPGARTRWAVVFGEPIFPGGERDRASGCATMREEIMRAWRTLQREIADHV